MRGFDFLSPTSLTAALRAIDETGRHCKILAGGTNVIPDLRSGGIRPRLVVDLGRVKALDYIREGKNAIKIGALTSINRLRESAVIQKQVPLLWEATQSFAGPLVRNRATVGGNLADASPAADTAVPLLTHNAKVKIRSLNNRRTVPLKAFFLDYRKTVLKPGEILTEIEIPSSPPGTKYSYCKLGRRNAMAVSVVSVAVSLRMKGKTCTDAAVALGAVAPTPLRMVAVEALLQGRKIDSELARQCGELAAKNASPVSDIRASAEYRRIACRNLAHRTICRCVGIEG
jgi:CO/xanthine dehydrogenase FAD-binding subunit